MSSSGPAAEGEGTPAQPASEKEPEMPGPREESEEEDEDDEEEEEEEEKGGEEVLFLVMGFTEISFRALIALKVGKSGWFAVRTFAELARFLCGTVAGKLTL